jgi:hypothetical protein
MKAKAAEEYVQVDEVPWAPFPDTLSQGGIEWKLLHVSPEAGTWTTVYRCPAGSSFNAHVHTGPGEYILTKGRMDVRGGKKNGGSSAVAPGYGYESSGSRHDKTEFLVDSEFYMTFSGPLAFINEETGAVIVNVGWMEVEHAWNAFLESTKKKSKKKAA